MFDLDKVIDEIDLNLEEISWAISMAFADGDEEKANSYYPNFYSSIKESQFFIVKRTHTTNKYFLGVKSMLSELSDYTGYDVNNMFYGGTSFSALYLPERELVDKNKEIPKKDEYRLRLAYFSSMRTFKRIGMPYSTFIDLYKDRGLDYIIKLSEMIKRLEMKTTFYRFKENVSRASDFYDFKSVIKISSKLIEDYNVRSVDDLKKLYTEVSSYFVDYESLTENEKKIIDDNRNSFLTRVYDKSIVDNPVELKQLRNRIERIYDNLIMRDCLQQSNIGDFFERYNVKFNGVNFKSIMKNYCYVYDVIGFCKLAKFNGMYIPRVFFNDCILSYSADDQDEIIIHEFIHCLEKFISYKNVASFNEKCYYLNEALTQYLALKAKGYLKEHIIKGVEGRRGISRFKCAYNSMLPLVDVLKSNPSLWNDIMNCKLTNNYSLFEGRLGANARQITRLFNAVYFKCMNFDVYDFPFDERVMLQRIVDDIGDKNRRYS
jgi:hypothetical protein